MTERVELSNIAIVLHQPHFPENIGAAARAMCNMGIKDLVVVAPQDFHLARALKMATHAAAGVVEDMQRFNSLEEALADFQFVVGTTARLGRQRKVFESPAALVKELVPISRNNRVALVFGPEDRGLTNDDIRHCQWLVNIPTDEFTSLNLAQAVMIICYELFISGREDPAEYIPRLANHHELVGMFAQLKDILVRICYINPENPDYWMGKLRQFFTRIQITAREVSIIRGICRQVDWYAEKRYEDGKQSKER